MNRKENGRKKTTKEKKRTEMMITYKIYTASTSDMTGVP